MTDVRRMTTAERRPEVQTYRLDSLRETSKAILEKRELKEIAAGALQRLASAVDCVRASIAVVNDSGQLEVLHAVDVRPEIDSVDDFLERQLIPPDKLSSGQAYKADIEEATATSPGIESLRRLGVGTFLVEPLTLDGDLIGALTICFRGHGPRNESVGILRAVADQLAIAIRQTRLLEQVSRAAQELEERVRERTAELNERNEELEAFSYTVSHDLRAPLRTMQGFGQALLEDYGETLDAQAIDFIRRIVDAAGRMDALVQDLLEYSRIARSSFELTSVDVGSVVKDAVRILHADIERTSAVVRLPRHSCRVKAHETTLTQVLTNLLSNAIKFVPEGQRPEVTVAVSRRGGIVRISVTDNGVGVPPEDQGRIFKIFERLGSSYEGTGIGLTIVRKAIERMHGRIGVKSKPGSGSTFWIELESA